MSPTALWLRFLWPLSIHFSYAMLDKCIFFYWYFLFLWWTSDRCIIVQYFGGCFINLSLTHWLAYVYCCTRFVHCLENATVFDWHQYSLRVSLLPSTPSGSEPWLLRYIQCRHRLPVDRYHGHPAWKLHTKGRSQVRIFCAWRWRVCEQQRAAHHERQGKA